MPHISASHVPCHFLTTALLFFPRLITWEKTRWDPRYGISEMESQRSFFLKSSPPPACSWPIRRNWLKGKTPRHVILQIYSTDKTLQNILNFFISEPFPLPPMDHVPVGVFTFFWPKNDLLMRVKSCFMRFRHFSSFHVETIWSIDLIIFTSFTMSNSSIHFKVLQ